MLHVLNWGKKEAPNLKWLGSIVLEGPSAAATSRSRNAFIVQPYLVILTCLDLSEQSDTPAAALSACTARVSVGQSLLLPRCGLKVILPKFELRRSLQHRWKPIK